MLPNDWPRSTSPSNQVPANSVGIVIPVRDGLKFLKLCLYSVLYFSDFPYSLTVVDNMSGLQTKKFLRSVSQNHDINVLRYDEEFNFAAQCNMGLKQLFANPNIKYGLVLNADAVVEPGWLSKLVMGLAVDSSFGIIGPVSNKAIPEQQLAKEPNLLEGHRVSGFCMMMTREVFEQTKGFDEGYTAGGFEDWDLCLRARELNFKVIIHGEVHVHHFYKMFRQDNFDQQLKNNEARFFQQHPEVLKYVERR